MSPGPPSGIGMSEAEIYASISDYGLLIEALDERRKELNLSCNELDDLASIATGYFAKCAGGSRTKTLGWHSVFKVSKRLGLRMVLEIDPAATAATLAVARPRQARQARPNNLAARSGRRTIHRALRHLALTCSWVEILKIVSAARAAVAAEQAAKTARIAERKAAVEANKQPPASSKGRRGANGTGQQNGNGTASAYDAPIGAELEQIADAASMRVSREDGERRGRKRGRVSAPFLPMNQHAINRRTQAMLLSKRAKAVSVAR